MSHFAIAMSGARLLMLATLSLCAAACAPAAAPGARRAGATATTSSADATIHPRSDSMPAYQSFTIASVLLGERRIVNVYVPSEHVRGDARLPVLYMPDGGLQEDFPHVASTVDSLIARGAIRPVLLVGIPNTQRRRDLTGPTRIKSDSAIAPRVGGSAAFRAFLRDELIREVDRRYRTTTERAIIGESLAGLFILETFLEEPGLFTHYVALDPSLWWNAGAMMEGARSRLAAMPAATRSLYVASSMEPSTIAGTSRLDSLLRSAPPSGLRWTYAPRPDLTHGNIFRVTKPIALVHAFGRR